MTPFFFGVVLPSTLVLGAALGCLDVGAFVLVLVAGLLLWIAAALLAHVPPVFVVVMAFCLAVTAQAGYAATLITRAHRIGRQRRSQALEDAGDKASEQSGHPPSPSYNRN